MFGGRRIVLGVTGGVAAYKAILLCRLLVDANAHVIPVMTESAQRFVGRATFDALASEAVKTSVFDDVDPIPHTTLGQTADLNHSCTGDCAINRQLCRRSFRRLVDRNANSDSGAGDYVSCYAHRNVGAPFCTREFRSFVESGSPYNFSRRRKISRWRCRLGTACLTREYF